MSFHVNHDGNAGRCKAVGGNCPFGGPSGEDNHFETRAEASLYAEAKFTDEMGGSFGGRYENYTPPRPGSSTEESPALASLRQASASRPVTERDSNLTQAFKDKIAHVGQWWDKQHALREGLAVATIGTALVGTLGGGIAGGYLAGNAAAENINGEQEVVSTQTHEGTLENYRTNGKRANSIDVDLGNETVRIKSGDVVDSNGGMWNGYADQVLSSSSEGDSITLTDITYRDVEDGDIHVRENVVLETSSPSELQRAVEGKSNEAGSIVGALGGAGAAATAIYVVGIAVMDRRLPFSRRR